MPQYWSSLLAQIGVGGGSDGVRGVSGAAAAAAGNPQIRSVRSMLPSRATERPRQHTLELLPIPQRDDPQGPSQANRSQQAGHKDPLSLSLEP